MIDKLVAIIAVSFIIYCALLNKTPTQAYYDIIKLVSEYRNKPTEQSK